MSFFDHTPKPITPDLVKTLWGYMGRVYGSEVVNKNNSTEMQIISQALGFMGIVNAANFMQHYTTTIGHRIYVPFDIGVPNNDWSLESQIVVCAHEHQHIIQYDADNFGFYWNYLTNADKRAAYETEAYRSTLELSMYYHHVIPNLHDVAMRLKPYNLTDTHVHVAEVAFASAARMIQAGLVVNAATKTALSIL